MGSSTSSTFIMAQPMMAGMTGVMEPSRASIIRAGMGFFFFSSSSWTGWPLFSSTPISCKAS